MGKSLDKLDGFQTHIADKLSRFETRQMYSLLLDLKNAIYKVYIRVLKFKKRLKIILKFLIDSNLCSVCKSRTIIDYNCPKKAPDV